MHNLCVVSVEVHPLLGVKGDSKSKKKTAGRPKGSKGKDKDLSVRSKPFRDRAAFPLEALGSGPMVAGPHVGGGPLGAGVGLKGRAEGLASGKN